MHVLSAAHARIVQVLLDQKSVDVALGQRPLAAVLALEDLALGQGGARMLERQAVAQLAEAWLRLGLSQGQRGHVEVVVERVFAVVVGGAEAAAAAAVDAAAARVEGPEEVHSNCDYLYVVCTVGG